MRGSIRRLSSGHVVVVVVVQQTLLLIEHAGQRALAADAHADQNGNLGGSENEAHSADDASGLVLLRTRHAEARSRRGDGGRAASLRHLVSGNEGIHIVAHSHRHHGGGILAVDGGIVVVAVVAARARAAQLPGSTPHANTTDLRRNVQFPSAVFVKDTVAEFVEVARDRAETTAAVPASALVVALARALRRLLAAAHIARRVRLRGEGPVAGVHNVTVVALQYDADRTIEGIHLRHRLIVQCFRVVATRRRIALLVASITNRIIASRSLCDSKEALSVHSEVGLSESGESDCVPLLSTHIVPTITMQTKPLLVDVVNTRVLSHQDESSNNQNDGRKEEAQAQAAAAASRTRSRARTIVISTEVVVKTKVIVSTTLSVTFSLSLGHNE